MTAVFAAPASPLVSLEGENDLVGSRPPVFLVGPARSGTSLLYKLLCLHPEVSYVSNWMARFPSRPALATLNRLARSFPAYTRKVWFEGGSNAYVYGRRRRLRERMYPMPVEGEPVFRASGVGDETAADPDRAMRELREVVGSIVRRADGPSFVNKRIANNRRISFLARVFPGARFIWIVRDGRAVAYSLSRVDWWEDSVVWWYGGTPRDWRSEGRDPWELCARNWVEELSVIERGLAEVPGGEVMRLSYEEFVRDPLASLASVGRFAGLTSTEGWRRSVGAVRYPDRNEGWPRALGSDVIETITSIQAEKLRAYGYEV
jgi:hypothetical protein